jgi:uncharacterized phage infection (PIP) family protein YhgE
MISEINESIRNKEQFIKNVNLYHYSDDGAITAKHICINEVAFLKELLQYVDRLESSRATEDEIKQLRDRHGHLDKMLSEAAQIIDDQTEKIGELQSDVEMFIDLCDKKDEWLEAQRKEIAELKIRVELLKSEDNNYDKGWSDRDWWEGD